MNKKRLPVTTVASPESNYYVNGKLGVIIEDDILSVDKAYEVNRRWAVILGS